MPGMLFILREGFFWQMRTVKGFNISFTPAFFDKFMIYDDHC